MNKWVVITGCSSGIGLCCAKMVKQAGYKVIVTARHDEDVSMLRELGFDDVLALELSDDHSIARAVSDISKMTEGNLYALFNNAAYGQPGAVEDLTRAVLREQFETNVFGTHELTRQLLPLMLRQANARIIQNSSVLGFAAMPMRGAYNASKFALEGLSDTLRMELKETSNIDVVLIEPGPILSKFRKNALKAVHRNINIEASRHKAQYQQALKRLDREGAVGRFTLPPEAVGKKLLQALQAASPKTRYYVTFPTYLLAFLRHILPTRQLDKILMKAGGA